MINKFFDKTFTILRKEWTTDDDGYQSSVDDEVGTFKGHLQQATPQLAVNMRMNFTTTFSVWCPPNTDVRLGDTIVYDGIYYTVREKQNNGFVGKNKHLELVVELSDDYGS